MNKNLHSVLSDEFAMVQRVVRSVQLQAGIKLRDSGLIGKERAIQYHSVGSKMFAVLSGPADGE